MICKKCGYNNAPKKTTSDPCWMYKVIDDEVKSLLFDPREIPAGWNDSPKAAKKAAEAKIEKPIENKPKRIRRTKAQILADEAKKNGNSSRTNK